MSSEDPQVSSTSWLYGPMLALDLETTGINPTRDRMVSFAAHLRASDGIETSSYHLVNPGVEIPAGATAQHGLTDQDVAGESSWDHDAAVRFLVGQIGTCAAQGIPVVVFNAPFDLTLLRHQAQLLELSWPDNLLVLDPLAIDRGLNMLRKGKRTLSALCLLYQVDLANAHDAGEDAAATLKLLQAMGERYPKVANSSIPTLMLSQERAHKRYAAATRSRLRSKGSGQSVDPGWPYRAAGRMEAQ